MIAQHRRHALKVSAEARTDTGLLGGGVDTDEDELGLLDGLVDVGGEEEVAAAARPDDLLETGLVDRELEVWAVPRVDTRLVQVDDGDLDLWALECNDGARWATCAGSTEGRFA